MAVAWRKVLTSNDGVAVTTGTQTIAGAKTFSSAITWSGGGSANANTAYGWGNHASAGYTTHTGDITGVTAGTGMSGGGTSGTVTLNCSITNNNQLTNGAGYTTNTGTVTGTVSESESVSTIAKRTSNGYFHASYFNGTGTFSTSGASSGMGIFTGTNGSDTYGRSYNSTAARALLNVANGATNVTNNNQISNGAGYTTSVGDITGVTAGSGMSGGGTSGSVTLTNASPNIVYPAETKSTINALDITEVGVISSGEWRGTVVDPSSGGTGLTAISTLLNTNVTSVSGNAGTVTNGVYTTGTQDVSGEKTFLNTIFSDDGIAIGGTGAANTLEDYEEGSWTPALNSGWSHSGGSTNNRYTKIGSFVHLWGHIDNFSGSSGSADLQITGLPFTVKHSAVGGDIMLKYVNWNSKGGNVSPYVNTSEVLYFFETAPGYEWTKVNTADLTSGSTDDVYFSIQYETDQ